MSTVPMDRLELRAVEQRQQLHARAEELKTRIDTAREKISLEHNARRNFGPMAASAAALAMLAGYLFTGMFTAR